MTQRALVIGGAGFIGSHLVDALVARGDEVTVLDNMSVGRRFNFRSGIVVADVLTVEPRRLPVVDAVYHLSANPEARRGLQDTTLDLLQGTTATQKALELARSCGAKQFVLASSGTVYGNTTKCCAEGDLGDLPISLYGASKLASEALVAAYQECFGLQGTILRFGNVVGSRATHGCILDFLMALKANPKCLTVLGDGQQKKPYLHVSDCVRGILHAAGWPPHAGPNIFNLAPSSWTSVRTIAELCAQNYADDTDEDLPVIRYTGGIQGWKGDVPISVMDNTKIRRTGFECRFTSYEAVEQAITEVAEEVWA